ncbi:MAG: choice-of-anchor Q domain-containing protein, partial [Betaproteobacteria bacterium]
SFGDRAGFVFDDSGVATITLVAGRNDSFGNAEADNFDGLPSGTVLNTNPQFLDAAAGNLRLQPSSQLVNAGVNAPAGGNSALDADGLARIQGGTIDVGAYEQAIRTQPEVPVPVAGPAGLAALALLLLAAAGTTLWRRASRR